MTCGVYQILNTVNGKKYIGSSVNIENRWSQHRIALSNNKHGNNHLQSAWNQYGNDAFSWSVLSECESSELREREQSYLPAEQTVGALRLQGYYNAYPVAGSPLGIEQSAESNAKRSEKLKGRQFTDEHRQKIGEANKRRVFTDEMRKRTSEANKRRDVSEDEKQRLRTMNLGKKFTDEHRAKIAAALKGKKHTDEHRKNSSLARKGIPLKEETKRKMSESQRRRFEHNES